MLYNNLMVKRKKSLFKRSLDLYKKYKEIFNYLFVGGFGTILSIALFIVFEQGLKLETLVANVISWIITVTVLYILNRLFVFEEHAEGTGKVMIEVVKFFSARLITLGVESLILFIFVDNMHYNSIIVKCLAQAVVIVLNYGASKILVFRK